MSSAPPTSAGNLYSPASIVQRSVRDNPSVDSEEIKSTTVAEEVKSAPTVMDVAEESVSSPGVSQQEREVREEDNHVQAKASPEGEVASEKGDE